MDVLWRRYLGLPALPYAEYYAAAPCGGRATTPMPTGGVFVHPEGCDGDGCDCVAKAFDV